MDKGREDEKKYYLKHMFINIIDDSNYLNMNIANGELLLTDGEDDLWIDKSLNVYKTRFTEREIEAIKDTGLDLGNFELVEVEGGQSE